MKCIPNDYSYNIDLMLLLAKSYIRAVSWVGTCLLFFLSFAPEGVAGSLCRKLLAQYGVPDHVIHEQQAREVQDKHLKTLVTDLRNQNTTEDRRTEIETEIHHIIFPLLLRTLVKLNRDDALRVDSHDVFEIINTTVSQVILAMRRGGTYHPENRARVMTYAIRAGIREWTHHFQSLPVRNRPIPIDPMILARTVENPLAPAPDSEGVHTSHRPSGPFRTILALRFPTNLEDRDKQVAHLKTRLKLIWPTIESNHRHVLWERAQGLTDEQIKEHINEREGKNRITTRQGANLRTRKAHDAVKQTLVWLMTLESVHHESFDKQALIHEVSRVLKGKGQNNIDRIVSFIEASSRTKEPPDSDWIASIQQMEQKTTIGAVRFFLKIPEDNYALEREPLTPPFSYLE